MKIATILFTYNRSEHTRRVLESLKNNTILPSKLYIFQDGMKDSTDIIEWEKVGKIIKEVDWCETQIHISEINRGVAASEISGITQVLQENDAAIVLEDDCVVHPVFMKYMLDGLNKYEKKARVYTVGACAWPVSLVKDQYDVYFNGRISSCGWGTWKDRWKSFERNYDILDRIKKNPDAYSRLEIWGMDLESMLVENIRGNCDTWAAFWALNVIEHGGYCLSPYESLLTNIGYDNSGVHSKNRKIHITCRAEDDLEEHRLPDDVEIRKDCEAVFKDLLTPVLIVDRLKAYQKVLLSWIEQKRDWKKELQAVIGRNEIGIWGKGEICRVLLNELGTGIKVRCIIESEPTTEGYMGIPVVSPCDIPPEIQQIIVIPYYDMPRITGKLKQLGNNINLIGIDQIFMGG